MAISKDVYMQLREQFWDVASWALWTRPRKSATDNVGDLSVFESPDLIDKLNGDYMFVALCGSGVHEPFIDRSVAWFNFHSSKTTGKDNRLRDATVGTPTEGCYITDFIKYHQEKDGKAAVRYIKTHREALENNLTALNKEIELLGGNPIIFALGTDSLGLIKEYLPAYSRVVYVPHYSAPVSSDTMKEKILAGIKKYSDSSI